MGLVRELRRRLLARPGITRWPVCPSCNVQRDPKDFVRSGVCWGCEQDAQERNDVRDAYYGLPLPVRHIENGLGDGPFLPGDEDR